MELLVVLMSSLILGECCRTGFSIGGRYCLVDPVVVEAKSGEKRDKVEES